jgi:hypothetical protein
MSKKATELESTPGYYSDRNEVEQDIVLIKGSIYALHRRVDDLVDFLIKHISKEKQENGKDRLEE